MRLNMIVFESC